MVPGCSINYTRRFSLPIGIAPENINSGKLPDYIKSLDIVIDILNNTFTKFTPSSKVNKLKFKKITATTGLTSFLFPFETSYSDPLTEVTLTNTQTEAVVRKGGNQLPIPAGLSADATSELFIKKVIFTSDKNKISAIPFPFHGLDSLRCFWLKLSSTPLTDTLDLNIKNFPDQTFLLKTFTESGTSTFGELNRLIVRSAALSLVAFEPYYHFEISSTGLKTRCPSNSGRIVIKTQNQINNKYPRLFESTSFAYENMDRKSVQSFLLELFLSQFRNFEAFLVKNEANLATAIKTKATFTALKGLVDSTPDIFKLEAPKTYYEKLVYSIRRAMVGWVLYVKNLGIGLAEAVNYTDIKNAYIKITVFEDSLNDTKASIEDIYNFNKIILGSTPFMQSFTNFLTRCYIPLSCGASWKECIDTIPYHDTNFKFPVSKNEAPKNATDAASKMAQNDHAWLEKIYNDSGKDRESCFICYSGCPLGFPSKVYHTSTPVAKSIFPPGAFTTFELEASILVAIANNTFSSVASYPAVIPGCPLDLTSYESFVAGYSCSLQLYTKIHFYTLIDWFQELLKETNAHSKAEALIDLTIYAYQNLHPIVQIIKFNEYTDFIALRNNMDSLDTTAPTSLALDTLKWWLVKNSFLPDAISDAWPDGSSANPKRPYLNDHTVFPAPDLPVNTISFLKGRNAINISGFDVFDMECINIAISMVKNPLTGNFDTPFPVVMALVLREGINMFQFLNRITRPVTNLRWIAHNTFHPVPLDANAEKHTISRMYWLAFPYGLDTYTFDPSITLDTTTKTNNFFRNKLKLLIDDEPILFGTDKESLLEFINERIGSEFNIGDSFPSIFKLQKRVHAAFITLMLAWYQHMHDIIINKKHGLTYTSSDWTTNDFSSIQDSITDLDTKRKDFITYYSMIYLAYNSSISTWNAFTNSIESSPSRTALGMKVRDYMLFKFIGNPPLPMSNMMHFAIGLDDLCRFKYDDTSNSPDSNDPNLRSPSWGV